MREQQRRGLAEGRSPDGTARYVPPPVASDRDAAFEAWTAAAAALEDARDAYDAACRRLARANGER